MVKLIRCVLLGLLLPISGCQTIFNDSAEIENNQQEYILSKVNNYRGLIKLYRDNLNTKEDAGDRYKLAKYYYLVEDYDASRLYLKPLLDKQPDEAVLLLESQNLLAQGKNPEALKVIAKVLQMNPNNGEAWNIRGILLAQRGNFNDAFQAFEAAQARFIDEDIVINNLAMLAIIQEDYAKARDYLVPMYSRGQASQKMLHNLVFVLVKLKDFSGAENILYEQHMTDDVDGLLESLAKIKPRSPKELQQIMSLDSIASLTQSLAKNSSEKPTPASQKMATAASGEKINGKDKMLTPTTSSLNEISGVRAGQHPKYFRMTLESPQLIKFRELSSNVKNKTIFELLNVKLTNNILKAGEKISRENHNIRELKIYQKNADTVGVEVEFVRPVKKNSIFRLSANSTVKERLVFDIYL